MLLKIENCNNIVRGEIDIHENKLNILFGCNGTGKTTIARAVRLRAQGKELSELVPYGNAAMERTPAILDMPTGEIAVFDDEYVNQYVYQQDSLIKETFEVLIQSKEYVQTKKTIDEALAKIKSLIERDSDLIDLQQETGVLVDSIILKEGSNKLIKRKKGINGVLKGKGAYFNPPGELNGFKPFFEGDTTAKWAEWRLKGYEEFGSKGKCPFCATEDSDKTAIINKVFSENFDKESIDYVATISKTAGALSRYLNKSKTEELISLFGVKADLSTLENQLQKLGVEAKYLNEHLRDILAFNSLTVDRDGVADLESRLNDMKINSHEIDTYFTSNVMKKIINTINGEIDSLLEKVGDLKREIARQNKFVQDKINNRRKDINEFLHLAGFKYAFDVKVDGENRARAFLNYVSEDGESDEVQSPSKHLSWGEKHSFALILFMFDAIRSNASLVILDDPISSFDSNKKFAIINRLFKTREEGNSLYKRTVLLLTHDFEPIIDFVQTNSGTQDLQSACATYLENKNGELSCTPIRRNVDMMSSVLLLKILSMDTNLDIAARIGSLRKYLEHQYKNPNESNAYSVLSSLIHGRSTPSFDQTGKKLLTVEQRMTGILEIKKFISDFDYDAVLDQLSPKELLNRYKKEESTYVKMQILRIYTAINKGARTRLKKNNYALRKYIDEAYHIENDYLYSLDVRRFNTVPENYAKDADAFVVKELNEYAYE